MDYWYLFFAGGILVRWITKVPWLKKWYRELVERNEHMDRLAKIACDKWDEIRKKEKELESLKK